MTGKGIIRVVLPWVLALSALTGSADPAPAFMGFHRPAAYHQVDRLNEKLVGQVLDYTDNHDCDRRIWSEALCEKRSLYVYIPPGYDGKTQFPAMLWLHGLGYDEKNFLDVVPEFDNAIRAGKLPPMIIAAPDGSVRTRPSLMKSGSFYVNSKAGNFEDYTIQDVWCFVKRGFAIRPERQAHIIAGASMGGFGAFNLGFKYRDEFGCLVGLLAPLNLRYGDCTGRYLTQFDPQCFELRDTNRRYELIGRFYGVILIRSKRLLDPLVGRRDPNPTAFVSKENPYELMSSLDVRPGDYEMFVGYGKKDQFNLAAQNESFLDAATKRGITPTVVVVPEGRHDSATAKSMTEPLFVWMTDRLEPFAVPTKYGEPPVRCGPLCAIRQSYICKKQYSVLNLVRGNVEHAK